MIKIKIENEYSSLKTVILGIANDIGEPPNIFDAYDPRSLYHAKNNSFPNETDLVKNVEYSGRTIEFWNSCDGIANEDYYQPMGEIHCGKGQPMQTIEMTHGCAPARFRGVETKSA